VDFLTHVTDLTNNALVAILTCSFLDVSLSKFKYQSRFAENLHGGFLNFVALFARAAKIYY
jgi:hypothetical protein